MSQEDFDPISNPSTSRHFADIVDINLKRRALLKSGLGAATLAFFGAPALTRMSEAVAQTLTTSPTFTPIAAAFEDTVRVPPGYSAQVLYSWGDPTGVRRRMPEFQAAGGVSVNTAEDQAFQAGMDHDGMHYFPLADDERDDDEETGRARGRRARGNAGLLCMNHENIQPEFLLAPGLTEAEQVAKMKNAHGISVIETHQDPDTGAWQVVRPSRYARRITADTPMRISGPAAGDAMLRTAADRSGRRVLGTLNNCANGFTPWGTYLTCEENFNGYFQTDSTDPAVVTAHMRRYGVGAGGFGYNWHRVDPRFDIAAEPNESNRFGWVVEIDPKNPNRPPVKRTALGRFKHENAAVVLSADRRAVVYMGDDERNEYIYKFVSDRRLEREDEDEGMTKLLDRGTLYVAVFEPGAATGDGRGSGRWVPLQFGQLGLTPENGFASQAEVLIKARQAGDRVGATMMDRPEWIAVHPLTKEVYVTLTNNNRRGGTTANAPDGSTPAGSARPPVDDANPRANNVYGHIVRWREAGDDPAAERFEWDVFLLAGDPADPGRVGAAAVSNTVGYPGFEDPTYHIFSAPDGLAFDDRGWLWIETDYGPSTTGIQANMGNCHMLLADVPTGRVGRFLTGPNGCEITGWTMTPDQKSLFVNIQHPGEGGTVPPASPNTRTSTWPNGFAPARSSTIVVTKNDGGVIGT